MNIKNYFSAFIESPLLSPARQRAKDHFPPPIPSIVSLMCYFSLAWTMDENADSFFTADEGVLIAIITGVFATKIFIALYSLLQRKYGHTSLDSEPILPQALLSIIPAIIVVILFTLLENIILGFGFKNADDALFYLVYNLIESIGSTFFKLLLMIILIQLMWFFGIHVNLLLENVLQGRVNNYPMQGLHL